VQFGTSIVAVLVAVIVLQAVTLTMLRAYSGSGTSTMIGGLVMALLVACTVFFATMRVRVDDQRVEWALAFGLFRRSVPFSEIEDVSVERVPLIAGLGWRTNGRDTMWRVDGTSVVALRLRTGRTVSLGSPDAAALRDVVERHVRTV
jgi:hypothetical protein